MKKSEPNKTRWIYLLNPSISLMISEKNKISIIQQFPNAWVSMKKKLTSFFTALDLGMLALVFIGLIGLYYEILLGLIEDWSTNDNYSHGFFIPIISLYMIYTMRPELKKIIIKPAQWGLLFLIIGLGQLLIATTGSEFFLQRTSMIPVLLGLILFLFGSNYTKKLLLPVCYLLFMIPLPAILWNKIAFPMQLFSTNLTEKFVQFIGISVFREGNILHLAQTTLEVVDACSGLRSLTTMFALSAALAWFASYSLPKKWFLFFMAAPIAIFANIIRLTSTAILASKYGSEVAQGFLHEFSGVVTFFLGLALLIGVNTLLSKITPSVQA